MTSGHLVNYTSLTDVARFSRCSKLDILWFGMPLWTGMITSTLPFVCLRGRTAKPVRGIWLWHANISFITCLAVAVLMSLMLSSGEAQAHGYPDASGRSAARAAEGAFLEADSPEGYQEVILPCGTCCKALRCLMIALLESEPTPVLHAPDSLYPVPGWLAAYEAVQHTRLPPPKPHLLIARPKPHSPVPALLFRRQRGFHAFAQSALDHSCVSLLCQSAPGPCPQRSPAENDVLLRAARLRSSSRIA